MKRWLWCALLFACAPRFDVSDNREPDDGIPVAEGDGLYHTVRAGENVYRISLVYGVAMDDLLGINDILDARKVRVGDVLFVPGATQERSAAAPPPSTTKATTLKEAPPPVPVALSGKLAWPVDGIVTSRFGVRGSRKHDGIDIAAPEGTRIFAAENGSVLYVGDGYRGYGNLIIVKHGSGLVTVYAHNRDNLVKEGQAVVRGQHIANVGKTGRAEAPHLHFEVRQLDKVKNPLLYLP